jgi:hypothetical protein
MHMAVNMQVKVWEIDNNDFMQMDCNIQCVARAEGLKGFRS